jgi:hypothetical protein
MSRRSTSLNALQLDRSWKLVVYDNGETQALWMAAQWMGTKCLSEERESVAKRRLEPHLCPFGFSVCRKEPGVLAGLRSANTHRAFTPVILSASIYCLSMSPCLEGRSFHRLELKETSCGGRLCLHSTLEPPPVGNLLDPTEAHQRSTDY